MNAQPENLSKLDDFFPEDQLEWRIQQAKLDFEGKPKAKVLCYVTNRAIQNRLDEVCGKEHWRNEFKEAPNGGVMCGISIRYQDEWVTKWDGADNTKLEAVKGGLSDSMKRAAVQWGIGRYLYDFGDNYAIFHPNGIYFTKIKDAAGKETWHKWNPPKVSSQFLPKS